MKKSIIAVLAFAFFFLFFIQMTGALIQSIYVMDLMNTSLDAKALGVLFFFTPLLLLPFRRNLPVWAIWVMSALLILGRGLAPSLPTLGRFFASGLAVGVSLLLFPTVLTAGVKGENRLQTAYFLPGGLALATGLSVFLRTLNFSVDYSLTPAGAWAGWLLGLSFALALTRLDWKISPAGSPKAGGITSAVIGIFLILTLVYFVFSAPAVVARWTEGNYAAIVGLVSLLSLASVLALVAYPRISECISKSWLVLWNILFTLSLTATILAHRITFPPTPGSAAVAVGAPSWLQQVPLYLMLLLFPVIFLDAFHLFRQIRRENPSPRALVPGILIGSLAMVILVFMTIFTNVWGYIDPVSRPFRNLFWLPFLLITGLLSLIVWRQKPAEVEPVLVMIRQAPWDWLSELAVIFVITLFCALVSQRVVPGDPNKTSMVVMTYNIQAGNDKSAELSYDRQLEVIRRVSPDIVALQETDTTRISLNNNDYVRYFAGKLGYYSYYGPTTVTGTFGTAILSRFPLQNTRSVFTFSDTDEIGTAEAQVEVDGKIFSLYDVHPDGSMTAKLAFARNLVERSAGEANVIALGDYNLRENQEAYQVVAAHLIDAWRSLHPDAPASDWIDHIFVSPDLGVRDPTYLLPPDSASDHPVHWTQIYWGK